MAIELSKMNEKDLAKLQGDIEKELTLRDKSRRTDARKAAEAAAKKHGFSLEDLLGNAKTSSSRKAPAPPKYRNPENPEQTWSGRGRQPDWYKAAIQSGDDMARFAI